LEQDMPSDAEARPDASPATISLGAIIGRKYRLDEVIAEGGMGVVYKGWHLVLEHPIAIKVVRPEYAHHPEAVARFLNEARASAQLHGIHVAHVLDTGRIENGPPYMVLEYLEGFDLRELLGAEGPLPVSRAVDYVVQTCEAVAEAHARGIIHRDLKPENLFVARMPDGSEVLKVIDFGISKRLDSGARSYTVQGRSLGSPHYMAPEQMTTPDLVDARADIWSLGVVLFELLTNRVPFEGETMQVACVKVLCEEPPSLRSLNAQLPPALEAVITRCLRKPPDERYPSVKELTEALVPFASSQCADSLGRVRRLLGDVSADSGEPTAKPVRVLPQREAVEDSTPLPPTRETTVNLRVPMRPLWPAALAIAATATLVILSRSDPLVLGQMAVMTAERVQSVARVGAHSVRGLAADAMSFLDSVSARALAGAPASSTVPPARSPEPVVDSAVTVPEGRARTPVKLQAPSAPSAGSQPSSATSVRPPAATTNGHYNVAHPGPSSPPPARLRPTRALPRPSPSPVVPGIQRGDSTAEPTEPTEPPSPTAPADSEKMPAPARGDVVDPQGWVAPGPGS
jgi:serine/threonine-protein kinase